MAAFDESDCCGNGCANCILDVKPIQQQKSSSAKINIINSYTNFTLKCKQPLGELQEIIELHFISSLADSIECNNFTLDVPSGNHIMMRAPFKDSDGKRLLRPYSPFWVDSDKLEFKILVNLSPNGPMSKYICSLCIGDRVEFRGPIGGHYAHNSAGSLKHLILISQGVAISPTIPIVNEILANEDDMTRIFQFTCYSNLNHAYFRKDLQEFKKFWNYTAYLYLSRQKCDDLECIKNKECATSCKDLAKKLLYKEKVFTKRFSGKELHRTVGQNVLNSAVFVISGSRNFQNQISDEIKHLGLDISDENLFLL